ncbi:hypothetical protein ACJJIR_14545 [Microbulbifer sp. SSSA008]|uniref:hypothetical protein n=1 Tax=Microbulbifer sp. SSSA008 TaxID=3243380 RepID=UPI004039303B
MSQSEKDLFLIYKNKKSQNAITEMLEVVVADDSDIETYIKGGSPFEYYFSDHMSDAVKGQFKNVFKGTTKASNLFARNPDLFISHGITSPQQFVDFANQGQLRNHPTFMDFVH